MVEVTVTKLMIVVGSVRPGRVGLPIAEWVRAEAEKTGDFEIDFVDLAELDLPFMDEPSHPRLQQYTKPHTIAWSERVAAADAFVFVTPEYNYSYSPALKNALDFLNQEWWMKPVGFVSYGGVSSGTRGVAALLPSIVGLGLVRVGANVELTFGGKQVVGGVFQPQEKELAIIAHEFAELAKLAEGLKPLRQSV
jgi:NAD(P)H-dependent FMN reductase